MRVKNIGVDLVEIKRFRKLPYKKNRTFYEKIFTEEEIKYCLSKNDSYPHFAARFAAKEAALKCLKSTVYKIRDVEIKNDKTGAPQILLKKMKGHFLISLSHTKDQAIAIALWFN